MHIVTRANYRLNARLARSVNDVLAAWRLVYSVYQRRSLIPENPAQLHTLPQAVSENSAVVLGRCGRRLVSTISSYLDSPLGLPLENVYPAEVADLRYAGRRICEIGLFADERAWITRSTDSMFELMRFGYSYARYQQADDILIGVHPKHVRFYQRSLDFEPIGEERVYASLNDHPVVPLRLNLHEYPSSECPPRGMRYCDFIPVRPQAFKRRVRLTPERIRNTPLAAYQQPQTID